MMKILSADPNRTFLWYDFLIWLHQELTGDSKNVLRLEVTIFNCFNPNLLIEVYWQFMAWLETSIIHTREDAGGLSRKYVLRIPSVS